MEIVFELLIFILMSVVSQSYLDVGLIHTFDFVFFFFFSLDKEEVNITKELPSFSSFMQHVEKVNGRVMVHCISGTMINHM